MPTSSLFWSNCCITVKLIPRNGDESLGEFGDDFKDPQIMQLTEFYRTGLIYWEGFRTLSHHSYLLMILIDFFKHKMIPGQRDK